MIFLHKNGLSNSFDFDKLNNHVEKLAAKNFEYKIKYENKMVDVSYSSEMIRKEYMAPDIENM